MLFMSGKTSAEGYFECRRNFEPTGEQIEIGIDGNLSGPTNLQKDFFRQVEAEYTSLVPHFIEVIEKEFGAWMTLPVIKDFAAEFKPTYLDIPACDQEPIEWEIVFDTVHDVNHTVTVGLLGYEPQYVRVDG